MSVTLATSDLLGTVTVRTSTIGLDLPPNTAINGGNDSSRGPGGQATLSAIALSRGENETYTYAWSVTDEEDIGYSYISSGSSPTFIFDPPNASDDYDVTVTATDADGESGNSPTGRKRGHH